ncbi:YihY/virulence factor BrkB family protein [Mangrovibacterium diazotrophicum]|uniref:Membrane protein n=1 Tax=Mangrovibacterium diazotrophicum TaxID=1261403 RepID=A0A419WB86_9BACT|nr:YihY/virulence factor BrkB family protein [Mangrovibacterium diazotrophicum]RKD92717.1 membrane protein [Mangrovibacterium diazotrophicum]
MINRYHRLKRFFLSWMIRARKVTLPGFDRIPLYDVGLFFFRSIQNGAITTRASAVAFSFFLAVFPTMIFLFTLIPYVPIANFQEELFLLIQGVLPPHTFQAVDETVKEVLTQPRGGLLSIGFFMGLIFSTNGLVSMMNAFDASLHIFESRPWYMQRLMAIVLLMILAFLLTIAISMITIGQVIINYLDARDLLGSHFTYYLLTFGKWIVIIALFFFAYSFLYYLAPARKTRWRFISVGGTMSTILSLVIILGFNYYITRFSQYNKLYGSIGALLVVLLLLYLFSLVLLFGFELNASLIAAKRQGKKRIVQRSKDKTKSRLRYRLGLKRKKTHA